MGEARSKALRYGLLFGRPAGPVMRPPSSTAVRLAVFYAAFFTVIGTLQPFWPLWLAAKGLNATEIGLVLAIGVGAKVIGLPLAAHVADRRGERQRPMLALAALSLLTFALFAFAESFCPLVLVSLLFFSLWPPVMSLGESLTIRAAHDGGFQYGRVRLWGSLAYIVAALAAGGILTRVSADAVFWMILAGVASTALACWRLPDLRTDRSLSRGLPLVEVLGLRSFVLLLAACGLIQGSHAVYYAFATIHWRGVGYAENVIGALWAEGVICEMALFVFGGAAIRRCGAGRLIVLAGLAAAARWIGTGLTDALPAVAVLQALHGISFGAAHLGAMHWIARQVPPALSATAQSLYSAIVFGLFLGVMLYGAGWLYEALAGAAYLPMAAAGFVGATCAWPLIRESEATMPSDPTRPVPSAASK
jgi:PPP family 3-phenylpropionic acid transporter